MLNLLNPKLFWYLALPIVVINGWTLLQIFQYFGRITIIAVSAKLLSFLLVIMLLLGVILIPLLLEQLTGFIEKLPSLLESGNQQ